MPSNLEGFFQGTEMPDAGWWEALWPDPFGVLTSVGIGPKTELRMSPQQTVEAIAPGGLTHVSTVEVPPYHYGALFERPA